MAPSRSQKNFSAIVGTASTIAEKFSSTVFLPALPAIAIFFSLDRTVVQQAVPVMLFGVALSQLVWGRVSDQFGPRRVLLLLAPIHACGATLSAAAPSFPFFLMGIFLQGFAIGAIFSVSQALVGRAAGKAAAGRILALIALVSSWASAVGAMLGGFIVHHLDWRLSFVFVGALVLGVGALCLFLPRDKQEPPVGPLSPGSFFGGYGHLLRAPRYLEYVLVVAWLNFGMFVFLTLSPFMMIRDWNVAAHQYGLFMFIPCGGLVLGRFLCTRLEGRVSADRLISIGGIVSIAGGLTMFVFEALDLLGPWTLMGSMAVYLVGLGLASPVARAKAMYAVTGLLGSGASLLSVIVNLLGAMGTGFAGWLPNTVLGLLILGGACTHMVLFRWMSAREAASPSQG